MAGLEAVRASNGGKEVTRTKNAWGRTPFEQEAFERVLLYLVKASPAEVDWLADVLGVDSGPRIASDGELHRALAELKELHLQEPVGFYWEYMGDWHAMKGSDPLKGPPFVDLHPLYARPIPTSPDTSCESKKLISAARIALVALSQADCRCSSTAFTRTICSRCTALADLRGAVIS